MPKKQPTEHNPRYFKIIHLILTRADYVKKISHILNKKPQTITEQLDCMLEEGFVELYEGTKLQYNLKKYFINFSKIIEIYLRILKEEFKKIKELDFEKLSKQSKGKVIRIDKFYYWPKDYKNVLKTIKVLNETKFISELRNNLNLHAILRVYLKRCPYDDFFSKEPYTLHYLLKHFLFENHNEFERISRDLKDKNLKKLSTIIKQIHLTSYSLRPALKDSTNLQHITQELNIIHDDLDIINNNNKKVN